MTALDIALATQLQKKIVELRNNSIETLSLGTCRDHSEYRYSCGYIKALDDAMTIAQEIVEDIQKG